jgi:hypothetical protein
MQHPNKHTSNIRLEKHRWNIRKTLAIYVYNYCNICNIRMKHLQHTSQTSETLETYASNMRFQRNISLLFQNGGLSARRIHRCRVRRSSREGRDKFGGEGHGGSTRSRWPQWITSSAWQPPSLPSCAATRVSVVVLVFYAPLARGPSEPPCGRTVRNSTFSEALIFR